MRFDKRSEIHRIASSENRHHETPISGIKLDTAEGKMIATDGRAMAIVPCSPDPDDEDGILPVDAIKEARKGSKKTEAVIQSNGSAEVGGIKFPKVEGEFCDWQMVTKPDDEKGMTRFPFNAKYFLECQKAMGAEQGVEIRVPTFDRLLLACVEMASDQNNRERFDEVVDAIRELMPVDSTHVDVQSAAYLSPLGGIDGAEAIVMPITTR